ncbi:MAG: hypothetical protein KCHDKBKB_01079 [Elusimicrobia bacterium]|nr:hypothetical protein [Elusimicrobiota bacterium]
MNRSIHLVLPVHWVTIFLSVSILLCIMIVAHSTPWGALILFALMLLAFMGSFYFPNEAMLGFFFFLPLMGLLGHIFSIRGIPASLPVLYGVASGVWWRSFRKQQMFELRMAQPVFIFSLNILMSVGVALMGFYPWWPLGKTVLEASWGSITLVHALGWSILSFLTAVSGLIVFCWWRKFPMRKEKINWLFYGFILAGLLGALQYFGVTSLGLLVEFLRGGKPQYNASFSDPNALGLSCALMLPLLLGTMFEKSFTKISLFVALSMFFLLLVSASRSAYLTFFIALLFLFPFLLFKKPKLTLGLFVLVGLLGFSFVIDQRLRVGESSRFNAVAMRVKGLMSGDLPLSSIIKEREVMWKSGWVTFQHHPVLGVGLGTYLVRFPVYKDEIGNIVNDNAGNQYLQIAAEQGLVGLSIFLFFIVAALGSFFSSPCKSFSQWGALSSLMGLLAGFFFGSHLINFEVAMFFWLIMAELSFPSVDPLFMSDLSPDKKLEFS